MVNVTPTARQRRVLECVLDNTVFGSINTIAKYQEI